MHHIEQPHIVIDVHLALPSNLTQSEPSLSCCACACSLLLVWWYEG